jgi:hypothetical protein
LATRVWSCRDQSTEVARFRLWIASIVALVLSYFWTRYTAQILMQEWHWTSSAPNPPTMQIAQVLAVPLMALLVVGAVRWIGKRGSSLHIPLAYMLWFGLLFLSVAPGGFSEDTFYTFHTLPARLGMAPR